MHSPEYIKLKNTASYPSEVVIGLFSTSENNPKMALSIFSDLDTPLWRIEVFLISIYKKWILTKFLETNCEK